MCKIMLGRFILVYAGQHCVLVCVSVSQSVCLKLTFLRIKIVILFKLFFNNIVTSPHNFYDDMSQK